ncbi:hypothetical protein CWI38_0825p0010 [Hamiltosporidium tvaerminnensis]|uniref:Uncharacterized protein n=1 Tax=Hamiltosporidium tvaerminnensis TaxID=1176355 RepID=A0A4Q9LUM1_9MICR|nr:hypothetical protein CWI38_0825p0010 [Hamiltosporidium tvaerminnensis]
MRRLESGLNAEESWERTSMGVIRAEMLEEPTFPLKEAKRDEDGVKILKTKNNTPLISQGGTTLEEPTINITEESDLGEETTVMQRKVIMLFSVLFLALVFTAFVWYYNTNLKAKSNNNSNEEEPERILEKILGRFQTPKNK